MPTPGAGVAVTHTDWSNADWRTSSRSTGGGGNCVEVAVSGDSVAMRDSKNPDGPVLVFSGEAWEAFIHWITSGDGPHR